MSDDERLVTVSEAAGPPAAAPRVLVHTLDGSYIQLGSTPTTDVMDLVDELLDPEGPDLFTFNLDDGRSQVHIPKAAIARVDVDWELGRWQRFTGWLLVQRERWL